MTKRHLAVAAAVLLLGVIGAWGQECPPDDVWATVQGDTVTVHHDNAIFNCCMQFDSTVNQYGYTVDIEEAVHCGIRTSGTLVDQGATWRLSLTPEATDRDLAATIACLSRGGASIDGRFSFRGELTADRPDAVLTRLKGPVHLTAENGRIRRFNLLSKILAVVNLTEVFRGRKPDLREAGFAYDSLTIDGTVEDGALSIEAATIDGSTMDLAASGTVDLASGETDLTVLVSPFKTANAIIRGPPSP